MRSIFAVTLLVAATVSASPKIPNLIKNTLIRFSNTHKSSPDVSEWPVVKMYDNMYMEAVVNEWDKVSKKFVPYKNMTFN
jgi:hypothetical protein